MTKNRILTIALVSALTPVALATSVVATTTDVARPAEFSSGTRPCFLERTPWNAALDSPPPRCP